MRHTTFLGRMTPILAVSVLILALAACNPLENNTTSMSQLQIISLLGLDAEGKAQNYVQSDVLFEDPTTGATSIVADIATVTMTAAMLDPNPINGTSPYANIQLTGYTVTYSRSDGKNTAGVDVPYPVDGSISGLIEVGSQTSLTFIIVRETAKQEPPLLNILQAGTRGETLTVTARVDFYGHDLTGANVTATGYIPITFANYAN